MPVIVIGADTARGQVVVPALRPASGEIRVFVTNPVAADDHRGFAKVAVGDLSDGSHVGGAAIGAFCAILIARAAHDDRERHFAATPAAVFAQWADGLKDAGVDRVIVVGTPAEIPQPDPLAAIGAEYLVIDADDPDFVALVAIAEARNPLTG